MGEITVVSLSGIYAHEGFHRNREGLRFIDCTDVRGTNGYCDAQAEEVLRKRLGESWGTGTDDNGDGSKCHLNPKVTFRTVPSCHLTHPLHFIDNGNYHYLSKLYTDMITEPFHLVVFDHHTDMQEPAFGGLLSCGSWVKEVLETNAFVQGVTIVGAGTDDNGDGSECHLTNTGARADDNGDGSECHLNPKVTFRTVPSCHPLYISIDKDVLSPTEVLTNWDQGEMTTDELFAQLDELCAHHEILGIDVCGDAAPDMDPSILKRAVSMNDALNRRFVEWYLGESGGRDYTGDGGVCNGSLHTPPSPV